MGFDGSKLASNRFKEMGGGPNGDASGGLKRVVEKIKETRKLTWTCASVYKGRWRQVGMDGDGGKPKNLTVTSGDGLGPGPENL